MNPRPRSFWNFALIFIIALLLSAGSARAQALPHPAEVEDTGTKLSIPGYLGLMGKIAGRTTPAFMFGANEKPSITGFLAVRDFHSKDKKIVYAQTGLAGKFQKGSAPSLHLVPLTVNFFAATAKLFSWKWALEHSTPHPMPDIFLGGAMGLQLDGNVFERINKYNIKKYVDENLYLMLYVRGL